MRAHATCIDEDDDETPRRNLGDVEIQISPPEREPHGLQDCATHADRLVRALPLRPSYDDLSEERAFSVGKTIDFQGVAVINFTVSTPL